MQSRSRRFIYAAQSVLLLIVMSSAYGYDRLAARVYARQYSEPVGMAIYKLWDPDCANFISQCLIAGGVRFRSSLSSDDNVTPEQCGELFFPSVNTKSIQNNQEAANTAKYSRTITGADMLRRSVSSESHGGREYTDPHPI